MPINELVTYVVACDRCNEIIAEGHDSYGDAIRTAKDSGAIVDTLPEHQMDPTVTCCECADLLRKKANS